MYAEVLASQVMRFADNYAVTVAQAVDGLDEHLTNSQTKMEALRWKLSQATAAFINASGPNPALNALDMVVLATVSRMVMEDEVERVYGPVGLPLLETHRRLEATAWEAIDRVLRPPERTQLMNMIQRWRAKNPNQRYVATARFRELADVLGLTSQENQTSGSIFGLLYLDPFAGLDPTAQAIEQTRQLAERAIYYSQRMPMLLNWQVQLLSLQLAAQPDVRQIIEDTGRLSQSSESFAKLADQMPKLINDQRQAAIQQVLDGLAAERTNFMAALASQETKASQFLAETRETITAADEMATSVDAAAKSLSEFVQYVSPRSTNPVPEASDGKSLNIRDYGAAAGQFAIAARDLNTLVTNLNQAAPELNRQIDGSATRMLRTTFWLGFSLIVVLLVGLVLAGLSYQALHRRLYAAEAQLAAKSSLRVAVPNQNKTD
jgi:hypothetical protein